MFSTPQHKNESVRFGKQIIHFGASIKQFEGSEWKEWILKFENLLKNLFWILVRLELLTDLNGEYHYLWEANTDFILLAFEEPPMPIRSWAFYGDIDKPTQL